MSRNRNRVRTAIFGITLGLLGLLAFESWQVSQDARAARDHVDRMYAAVRDGVPDAAEERSLFGQQHEKYGPLLSYRVVGCRPKSFGWGGFEVEVESTRQKWNLREIVHVRSFFRTNGYRYKLERQLMYDGHQISHIGSIDVVSAMQR